jgi:hypothetical protein
MGVATAVLTNVEPIDVGTIDLFEHSNGPGHGARVGGDAPLAGGHGAALLVGVSGAGAADDGHEAANGDREKHTSEECLQLSKEGDQQN